MLTENIVQMLKYMRGVHSVRDALFNEDNDTEFEIHSANLGHLHDDDTPCTNIALFRNENKDPVYVIGTGKIYKTIAEEEVLKILGFDGKKEPGKSSHGCNDDCIGGLIVSNNDYLNLLSKRSKNLLRREDKIDPSKIFI